MQRLRRRVASVPGINLVPTETALRYVYEAYPELAEYPWSFVANTTGNDGVVGRFGYQDVKSDTGEGAELPIMYLTEVYSFRNEEQDGPQFRSAVITYRLTENGGLYPVAPDVQGDSGKYGTDSLGAVNNLVFNGGMFVLGPALDGHEVKYGPHGATFDQVQQQRDDEVAARDAELAGSGDAVV